MIFPAILALQEHLVTRFLVRKNGTSQNYFLVTFEIGRDYIFVKYPLVHDYLVILPLVTYQQLHRSDLQCGYLLRCGRILNICFVCLHCSKQLFSKYGLTSYLFKYVQINFECISCCSLCRHPQHQVYTASLQRILCIFV